MGRIVRVTLAVPEDVAAFVGDPETPPALAGRLLAEVLVCSTRWHIGPPGPAEDAAPVGVVLIVYNPDAAALLEGTLDTQAATIRRVALVGSWLFIGAEAAPTLWPPVALQPTPLDLIRRAEDSAAEWSGLALPPPSARFELRRVPTN